MGAHERAHFAATRKKLWGPARPLVPYHRASSIFGLTRRGGSSIADIFIANGREDAYEARTAQRHVSRSVPWHAIEKESAVRTCSGLVAIHLRALLPPKPKFNSSTRKR
jgi:hypothetical protein